MGGNARYYRRILLDIKPHFEVNSTLVGGGAFVLKNHPWLSAKKSGTNARYYRRILLDITGAFWEKSTFGGGGFAQKVGAMLDITCAFCSILHARFQKKSTWFWGVVTTMSKSRTWLKNLALFDKTIDFWKTLGIKITIDYWPKKLANWPKKPKTCSIL